MHGSGDIMSGQDQWYDKEELKGREGLLGKEFIMSLHRSHACPDMNYFIKQAAGVTVEPNVQRALESMRSCVGSILVLEVKVVAHNFREESFDKVEYVLDECKEKPFKADINDDMTEVYEMLDEAVEKGLVERARILEGGEEGIIPEEEEAEGMETRSEVS